MINELLFLGSAVLVVMLDFLALLLGKEFLLAMIVTQGLLANIFIIKQVCLFGLVVTCTDVFIIGIVLAINLLEEIYGKEASSRAITTYLFSLLLVFLFTYLHLWYQPALVDQTQEHYQALFEISGRIILATLTVSFLSLHLDRYLYRLFSAKLDVAYLPLKNFLTTAISQFFDTVLFSYLALYGVFTNMWDLIVFSYIVKMLSLLITTVILTFAKGGIARLKARVA